MSERWQTGAEIEKTRITLGLRDKADLLEDKSKKLFKYSFLCALGSEAMFGAAILTDHFISHDWGVEQDVYASVGGLLVGIAEIGYRKHKSAKNRAFDVERQLIELELETD